MLWYVGGTYSCVTTVCGPARGFRLNVRSSTFSESHENGVAAEAVDERTSVDRRAAADGDHLHCVGDFIARSFIFVLLQTLISILVCSNRILKKTDPSKVLV